MENCGERQRDRGREGGRETEGEKEREGEGEGGREGGREGERERNIKLVHRQRVINNCAISMDFLKTNTDTCF